MLQKYEIKQGFLKDTFDYFHDIGTDAKTKLTNEAPSLVGTFFAAGAVESYVLPWIPVVSSHPYLAFIALMTAGIKPVRERAWNAIVDKTAPLQLTVQEKFPQLAAPEPEKKSGRKKSGPKAKV